MYINTFIAWKNILKINVGHLELQKTHVKILNKLAELSKQTIFEVR